MPLEYIYNDGGRSVAGFSSQSVRDCVTRAIAIATGRDYRTVYDEINKIGWDVGGRANAARLGVPYEAFEAYMRQIGWQYVPMPTTSSKRVNLVSLAPIEGTVIIDLKGHAVASVEGVLHDSYNTLESKYARRIVQGYFRGEVH